MTTHVLREGRPLCGFAPGVLPGQWPEGHTWVRDGEAGVTCSGCVDARGGARGAEALEERPCKGCGRRLAFVKDQNGKTHPLDLVAPTFAIRVDSLGHPFAERASDVYVSHFATCPKANDFSKGGRK